MRTSPAADAFDWATLERVVVLSPHLDDAVLSAAGLLTTLRGRVSRLVITLACGNPTARVPARAGKQRSGHTAPRLRRREDIEAMHDLDCDFVHLGFADAIYRRSATSGDLIYRRPREPFARIRLDDASYAEELYLVLRRLVGGMGRYLLVSPLGIGAHVDHVLCAQVALRLRSRSTPLLFYEDFPYVAQAPAGASEARREAFARLGVRPIARVVAPVDVEEKARLVERYESQIPPLFGDGETLRARLRTHAAVGGPCELFWQPAPARPRAAVPAPS